MNSDSKGIDKNARIAIVGAGPAGLSTAWFLWKKGYHNVTVLEKLGRVGGLCKSITIDGDSYDLGANYLTWAYTETLKIADEVGAKRDKEKPYTSINLKEKDHITDKEPDANGKVTDPYRELKEAILYNPIADEEVSLGAFGIAALRYFILRRRLAPIIDRPDYLARINNTTHPELCVTFKEWLCTNNLDALTTLFEFPITVMGYGQLRHIPTPYALRYMSLKTFFPMVAPQLPLIGPLIGLLFPWPKRLTLGFQRLWEKVSWRLNVRLNVDITKIRRNKNNDEYPISIDFTILQQELNEIDTIKESMYFNYLILGCPLTPDVFEKLGLERSSGEEEFSDKIHVHPYCMTTYWVENMKMPEPIAPIFPLSPLGEPWAVARQFQGKGNNFTQFYTRPKENEDGREMTKKDWDAAEKEVKKKVRALVTKLRGEIADPHSRWHTYDRFTYFQHVEVEDIADGFYENLEKLQGQNHTFYVGGVTDFELIEPIVQHSKFLVEKHFTGRVFRN